MAWRSCAWAEDIATAANALDHSGQEDGRNGMIKRCRVLGTTHAVPNLSFFIAYDFQVVPPAGCDRYSVSCGYTLRVGATIAIMTIAVHSQPTNGVRGDGMVTTQTQSCWVTGIVWQFRWRGGL